LAFISLVVAHFLRLWAQPPLLFHIKSPKRIPPYVSKPKLQTFNIKTGSSPLTERAQSKN